jgi:hypothetical protein
MLPRDLCDRARLLAAQQTGIPAEHILIAATHTHSAPSVMDFTLGSRADAAYTDFLPGRIAVAVSQAHARLEPAQLGSAVVDAAPLTACRRWITRSDQMLRDPFGRQTVRAMMHPGHQNAAYVGPSGPEDPWLSLLSVQAEDGRPLAILANFSMHYFGGHPGISADYFGRYCRGLQQRLAPEDEGFVGILSQGTSGDLWRTDYGQPPREVRIDDYTAALLRLTIDACQDMSFTREVTLAMAHCELHLQRRCPDAARLAWARRVLDDMGPRRPENKAEVYAEQAVYLHEHPQVDVLLQAIRIGDLGIAAIPNEVYGLTGLKLKARSPLVPTFTIELANGAAGYIPPPEQHALGGYTTWPARTAGLEVQAEPKVVEAVLRLLEQVSDRPRRQFEEPPTAYARAILASKPWGYWRLADLEGDTASDASGNGRVAKLQGGFAFLLPGADFADAAGRHTSHAVHFAGGRMVIPPLVSATRPEREEGEPAAAAEDARPAKAPSPGRPQPDQVGLDAPACSVEFWCWNGIPTDSRPVVADLVSQGRQTLLIEGTAGQPGRLRLGTITGKSALRPRTWHHLVLVHDRKRTRVFLDGTIDLEGEALAAPDQKAPLLVGGAGDGSRSLEGKLDEVAVYDRALSDAEVAEHFREARRTPPVTDSCHNKALPTSLPACARTPRNTPSAD